MQYPSYMNQNFKKPSQNIYTIPFPLRDFEFVVCFFSLLFPFSSFPFTSSFFLWGGCEGTGWYSVKLTVLVIPGGKAKHFSLWAEKFAVKLCKNYDEESILRVREFSWLRLVVMVLVGPIRVSDFAIVSKVNRARKSAC